MSNNNRGFLFWLTLIFSCIWAVLIGLDYGNKHPGYYFSFAYFRYFGLYATILIFIGGSYFLKTNKILNNRLLKPRGIQLLIVLCTFLLLVIFFNKNYGETETSIFQVLKFWSTSLFNLVVLFLFFFVQRSFGHFIRNKTFNKILDESFTVDAAIGIGLFTLLLFFTGAFGLLSVTTVMLFLFLTAVINVTFLIQSIKEALFNPLELSNVNLMGWASFLFVLFFMSVNFLSIHVPFPSGFDSRNVYVNISQLISESGSLVEGYQPYNWSLLMSVGFIMFDYVELALGLSLSAIVLAAIGVYEFSSRTLRVDKNQSLFVIALFLVTPALVNQMFVEIKVDFGMLFIQIASIIVFFQWLSKSKTDGKTHYKLLVLIGMLCGFGMGIKLINMFLVFVLLGLIWWRDEQRISLVGILLISVGILIFAGIDDLSGLKVYHKSIAITSIGCGVIGIGMLLYDFIKDKSASIRSLLYSSVLGLSLLVTFSPWIGKNFLESKSLNPKTLLLGKKSGPENTSFFKIKSNYEKKKKK